MNVSTVQHALEIFQPVDVNKPKHESSWPLLMNRWLHKELTEYFRTLFTLFFWRIMWIYLTGFCQHSNKVNFTRKCQGVVLIIGEPGSGKSLSCQRTAENLERNSYLKPFKCRIRRTRMFEFVSKSCPNHVRVMSE